MNEKTYHFKNKITGVQQDLNYDDPEDAEKHLEKLGHNRWTMSERLAMLREDNDYQEFFKDALRKFGSKTPAEMSDEEKKKFFNYIDKEWDAKKEMDEERIVRQEIRRIFEEKGLTKKFDRIMSAYHQMEKEINDVVSAMERQKKSFVKSFKSEKDDKKKEQIKNDHIKKMKDLAAELKKKTVDLKDKKAKAEQAFMSAVDKLAVPDEAELLE